MIVLENYCNKSKFARNLSFHFFKIKFPGNFHLSLEFSKNNHDNYLVIAWQKYATIQKLRNI